MAELAFEKPIIELRQRIQELRRYTDESGMDFEEEIRVLEGRLETLQKKVYANITPWDRVAIARHPERPTTIDYIQQLFTQFLECHGDRCFGDDEAIVGGIAKFKGIPVTVIGHQRGKDTKENIRRNFGMAHPEGYRKALRLMKQAEKFNRPIICFIDTKGAYPGKAAEERGQSEAIAFNLFEMASLTVPVISVVIGEGGSGGALALGVGNKLYMLENATYSVISPEGAAAILWKDASKAKEAAETMKITAQDLKELGIIDEIVPEVQGGAHRDVSLQGQLLSDTIEKSLGELQQLSKEELVEQRYAKFMEMGRVNEQEEIFSK